MKSYFSSRGKQDTGKGSVSTVAQTAKLEYLNLNLFIIIIYVRFMMLAVFLSLKPKELKTDQINLIAGACKPFQ